MKKLQEKIHKTAVEKGWWVQGGTEQHIAEQFANFHGELSEAWEEYRKGHPVRLIYHGADGKPEGIPIELADCVIRIMDFCEGYEIDLENAINMKVKYNELRPFRHGGKKA